ncbi:MAG: HlyD family efflux transporter periplasmic adaptor subunit [Alphaproteobacteria bacterium]|nr:HlyD family efflux transporter periplasmic adaptor subunit [Alphaproteobacteria bacterium]
MSSFSRATDAVPGGSPGAAERLLAYEAEVRAASSTRELGYVIVSGGPPILAARQAFLLLRAGRGYRMAAATDVVEIDRTAPFVRAVERLAATHPRSRPADANTDTDRRFILSEDLERLGYPLEHLLSIPLRSRGGRAFGCVLLARESAWSGVEAALADRLGATWAHAWEALTGPARLARRTYRAGLLWVAGAIGLAAAGAWPVPMSALGPATVTARNPVAVAAPADGVIARIEVAPNQPVAAGDVLFRLEDVVLRNRVEVARREVEVAASRHQQAERLSFAEPRAARELAVALAELELRTAEYTYAQELLERSVVRAPAAGIAQFSGREEWTGKPVVTGERVMRVADPADVELTVHMPVSDAIVLETDAPVRLFLDTDPLRPRAARVLSSSYLPVEGPGGVLGYEVKAQFLEGEDDVRVGLVGTAEISGADVALAYYLLRRPLSALRQWTGL